MMSSTFPRESRRPTTASVNAGDSVRVVGNPVAIQNGVRGDENSRDLRRSLVDSSGIASLKFHAVDSRISFGFLQKQHPYQ